MINQPYAMGSNVDESHINNSLARVLLSTHRDKNGIHTATSLMFPEITVTGKTLDEAIANLQNALRSYQPYRFKILYSWIC